jgi:hypothetical protein
MKFTRVDHGDYYEEIYDPALPQHDDPEWPALDDAAQYGLAGSVVFPRPTMRHCCCSFWSASATRWGAGRIA